MFFLTTIVHPIALVTNACLYTYFEFEIQHLLVFILPSLTITLIATFQCYAILAGMIKVTYKRVIIAIVITWSAGLIFSITGSIGYIYTSFRSKCGPTPTNATLSKLDFDYLRTAFVIIDGVLIDIPCFVVILVMTAISCGYFYKYTQNPNAIIQRKMFLLPILMTTFFLFTTLLARFLFPVVIILDRSGLGIPRDYPISIGTLLRLVSQSNSLLFAALFIGLQKNFRKGIVNMLKNVRQRLSSRGRVSPALASMNEGAVASMNEGTARST